MAYSFKVSTEMRTEFVDITDRVEDVVTGLGDGVVVVFSGHTTTGLTVNENESGLISDMESFLGSLVGSENWLHDRIDDNADSHLRGLLLDSSLAIPFEGGELLLGSWQSIFLVELDGPRDREVVLKVVG
ncbi:secondary thiamine-phosphate synthase enzyme YjbQ [Methanonatronarchaeum sp. AMET-Sl]|uniref:secondary thiamine-phosphate synthase enzyme YjbQ n=1 Tax=Methanonatronarchaeum sp. AMET-Sl TaxID=3037654 RepID=UPI00244E5389|nr:secondary thiamine-phosphate synthase enzyme YjbQ [Methanonatronarchaeum sp. AMET-Sl]WGI17019.1 secondary thiamine-phosphate synthase enzyme YjbQ [Methanonatronarchaeum sp. AMET-Sl]